MDVFTHHRFLDLAWGRLTSARGPGFTFLFRTLSAQSQDAAIDVFLRSYRETYTNLGWLEARDFTGLVELGDPGVAGRASAVRALVARNEISPPAGPHESHFGALDTFRELFTEGAGWWTLVGGGLLRYASPAERKQLTHEDLMPLLRSSRPEIRTQAIAALADLEALDAHPHEAATDG